MAHPKKLIVAIYDEPLHVRQSIPNEAQRGKILHFYLNRDTCREVEVREGIYCSLGRVNEIN